MKTIKIFFSKNISFDVPEVVITRIMMHSSELIKTWDDIRWHFEKCDKDCFEIWCRLQTGSTPHESVKALDRYVNHVGQLPPDWGNLFHHRVVCTECNKEDRHAKSSGC